MTPQLAGAHLPALLLAAVLQRAAADLGGVRTTQYQRLLERVDNRVGSRAIADYQVETNRVKISSELVSTLQSTQAGKPRWLTRPSKNRLLIQTCYVLDL